MSRLKGKIVVITGSNSGIGLASAKRFVAEGAYVYITGRRQEELDKAVQAIGAAVTAVQGDVSNLEDLDLTGQGTKDNFARRVVVGEHCDFAFLA
jgi:NAD(P)-dependent dehydrogenase (short-subunit alcohol dehydrogenase family)